jgi:MADS-box transcription factor
MNSEFLPSPSSFYPNWNFGGGESNTLPSPLNFQTPVVGTGPSFLRDEAANTANGKRKTPEGDDQGQGEGGNAKRVKTEN